MRAESEKLDDELAKQVNDDMKTEDKRAERAVRGFRRRGQ